MNGSQRFPRQLAAVLMAGLGAAAGAAPLNDTGQNPCYNGTGLVACTAANTGDAATYPRQDGRFGRDAAALAGAQPKTGGGVAGFDFTRVCMNGQLAGQGTCPAVPTQGTGADQWACTKDNVTGLIWSLESGSGNWAYATTTYPAAMNTFNRCGFNTGWRAPTVRELLSIINDGTYMPAIDANYFPATQSAQYNSNYWTADAYVPPGTTGHAWYVQFFNGYVGFVPSGSGYWVRLVRSGQ